MGTIMKKLICLLALGLLVGCGPSAQERYDAALKRLEIEEKQLDEARADLEGSRGRVRDYQYRINNADQYYRPFTDEEKVEMLKETK